MPIKTRTRLHSAPLTLPKSRTLTASDADKGVEQQELSYSLYIGLGTGTDMQGTAWQFLIEGKIHLS